MIATVGYYAGYLSGMAVGFLVGWIFKGYAAEDDTYVPYIPNGSHETVFGRLDTEVPNEKTEETDVPIVSPWCSERAEEVSVRERDFSPDFSGPENVIYIRLTDKSLASLLTRISEDSLKSGPSDTPANPSRNDEKPAGVSTGVNTLPEIGEDEMSGIFEEEDRLGRKTIDEKLDIGRKMPTRPVAYPTSIGGGYATLGQIEDMRKKHEEYKESTLTRSEELEIISAFRGIVGKNFYDAQNKVKDQGYALHVLYVGDSTPKRSAQFYSATTLGVRIEDDDFESGIPSVNAKITEIIDVGGVDPKNKGAPRN